MLCDDDNDDDIVDAIAAAHHQHNPSQLFIEGILCFFFLFRYFVQNPLTENSWYDGMLLLLLLSFSNNDGFGLR